MVPLVKSIVRELQERRRSVRNLERRLEAFASTRSVHDGDIRNLQAELAIHRRELRRCEKELAGLGCTLDVEHRIVGPDAQELSGLDDTLFRPRPIDSPA
jgi:hypothetical protein